MFNPATQPPAPRGARPFPETVRVFLVESERRVLMHCRRMLAREKLPTDERQRLVSLAIGAEQEISRLTGVFPNRAAWATQRGFAGDPKYTIGLAENEIQHALTGI